MCHLVEKIADFMTCHEVPYQQLGEGAALRTYNAVNGHLYHTNFIPIANGAILKTFAVAAHVTDGAVKEVAALANQWNVRSRFGHWTVDGDGDVVFETTHFVPNEDKWDVDTVGAILIGAQTEVGEFVPAVLSILYGGATAAEAFKAYHG